MLYALFEVFNIVGGCLYTNLRILICYAPKIILIFLKNSCKSNKLKVFQQKHFLDRTQCCSSQTNLCLCLILSQPERVDL